MSMTWGEERVTSKALPSTRTSTKWGKLHLEAKVGTEFLFGLSDNGRRALPIHIPKDLIMTQFVT